MLSSHRFGLAVALLLTGAAPLVAQPTAKSSAVKAPANAGYGAWGVDLDARDPSIDPGDDFWRYANNGWFKSNPIPKDRTAWGVSGMLGDDVEKQLRVIVEQGGTDPAGRQVADLYASWMDEAGIEARGTAPLRPYLARISAIRNRDDLLRVFAMPGYAAPVGVSILPDPSNPTRYIAAAGQAGLGLPRDYYLKEGEQFDRYRTGYRDYIIQLHRLAGIANPEAKADSIIALERKMAEVHWTPERNRDIRQIYNPMNREQLTALAPQFDWTNWLDRQGFGKVETIVAAQPSAITELGKMLETVPLETWKDYLAFRFINGSATALPRAFDEANFNFYGRMLRGTPQQRERWQRGLGLVNGALGEAVGRIYMDRHFPPASRNQMGELITNLRGAFAERLRKLEWMDEATRREAIAKLDAFDPRIGGPERFIDYSSLQVDKNDLIGNIVRSGEFQRDLQLSRLPHPVDRSLWAMTPQTINAYYSPLSNQITFPAAILQAPYFNPKADPAVNYGAIGAVIGHEIGHGFDDQGRRFDATGRVRDWWTEASAQRFAERAAKLGAQFAKYEGIPGQKINPQLTMGENIGDLGGMEMAYAAYRRHVAQHGEAKVIDGLTGDQRFFLAYAQAWRNQIRPDALRTLLLTDTHSPPEWRVNGIVRNVDAWYRAFNVKPDDSLYLPPEQRVSIW